LHGFLRNLLKLFQPMSSLRKLFFSFILFLPYLWGGNEGKVFAQRSKHGAKVVAGTITVNEYTNLTLSVATGATQLKVNLSTLNANVRFPGNLVPGDLIIIMQMQGATLSARDTDQWTAFPMPEDSSWGMVNNYNNCGNWEFAEVTSVPDINTINLDCPLTHSYTATGIGKTQVIRVPRYSTLTVGVGTSITCDAWNGIIGGVCAIEVEFNSVITGTINTTGKGFRGGALHSASSGYGISKGTYKNNTWGAEKGESIAGYQTGYDPYGGRNCFAAPANGGGGGNAHNCGGGGGANAGDTSLWNGHGNPDNTGPSWPNAWDLQYAGFSAQTSSGGGQGGYGFSNSSSPNNPNPITTAPNLPAWGGDKRPPFGGSGGRPLDYSTGRLFLGGGGGAGDQDNGAATAGASGGGLIYLMNYGTVSGTGQFIANGNASGNTVAPFEDGAGGAGGGGTIVVNSVGAIAGTLSINANGGKGGNHVYVSIPPQYEAEGPGGGGGGGYIAISNGAPTRTTTGGANGTSTAPAISNFTPNGATKGGAGINNAIVTNFSFNAPNTTICAGQSATLTAAIVIGILPASTNYVWYDALVAGNVIGNGATYVTPVLGVGTYTYYVGTCPGTYHQPVVVTVTNNPTIAVSPNATICSGSNTTLTASGGANYNWSPATGLSNTTIANPIANPVATTTYVVSATTPCGPGTNTVVVTVNTTTNATVSANTTICAGSSATLSATGGGNYSWTTGATTSAITVTPTASTTYSVFVGSGSCADTASTTVTISNGINATVTGPAVVCSGGSAILTASGGSNYSWTTGQTGASITVTPTASTTYTVFVTSGICSGTSSITVNVGSNITALVAGSTTICGGSTTTLSASGGSSYSWSTGSTSATITITPLASTSTTYTVFAASGTCADTATFTVNSLPPLFTFISGNNIICQGDVSTLIASVNVPVNNTYQWSTGSTATAITVSPSVTTTYTVTGYSGTCFDTEPVTVTVVPQASAVVSPNTTICAGQSTVLTVSGGSPYSWSTGSASSSITVSPLIGITYTVIAGVGACTDTDSVSVAVIPSPTVTVSNNTTICPGDVVTLNASGGSTYAWSNGATSSGTTVNPGITTTYTVVTTSGICTDTGTVKVTVSSAPVAVITGGNICQGLAATLTASGGGTYLWSTGATTQTINPTISGTYSVVVSVGSCTDTTFITSSVVPNPTAAAFSDVSIIQGQSANLSATGGTTYVWDNSMNGANITVSPNTTTVYCVTVIDANGCLDSACVTVTVEQCSKAGTLYLPNAFSPNNDGDNDSLQIYYGFYPCIKNFHLVIYNRWGERVFETSDPQFKWNGTYTSGLMKDLKYTKQGDTEVYAFYMDAEIMDGTRISKKGSIYLLK
jgi:gliding motility-associated-like protein